MTTWTPDPTFYPSPRMAMKAPAETLAYVAAFDPDRKVPDAHRRGRCRSRLRQPIPRSSAPWRCRMPATSCIISAGTPARRASAPTRRIPTSSGAISSCRACAPRASTSSTPSPTPGDPKIVKVIEPRRGGRAGRLHAPAHRALRARRHLCRGARQPRGQGAGRRVPDGPRDLRRARPVGDGPRAAAVRLRRLVASRPRHHGDQRVGHARHLRERAHPGGAARRKVRPPAALLGSAQAQAPADHRLRRQVSAGVRAAAGARSRPRPTASSTA